ncbi:MAG: type II secretion system F family protein [Rhodospirillales bacterium]|nr:type II secretion system F family protein [Alphaproteobacteria bacterium]MCB9981039.1 type II secretion system F family protein [Rhodospirillales bacterium]
MSVVQIILIVLIAILVVGIIVAYMAAQESARKKRVMGVIQGKSGGAHGPDERGLKDRRRADLAKKLKEAKGEENSKKKTTISLLILQAGISISVKQFWLMSVAMMIGLTFLAKLMGQPPHVLIAVAVIGLFGLPRFVLKKMAARRQKKFLEEFPDALEATVRLLKAGMPVSEAIAMISREFTGPVGEEMGNIYDKQKIGVALAEAALEATRSMPLTEMQMFATGLSIQAQTGSSLSEVLMNLSNVIRARFRLKRKIKALSSEAIASASIIAALPVLVATGMYFVNYEYISVLFTDPFGNVLLAIAIFWMGMGVTVMKIMINFKV